MIVDLPDADARNLVRFIRGETTEPVVLTRGQSLREYFAKMLGGGGE